MPVSKRLEQGSFAWPNNLNGVMRPSRAQYKALFEGLEWRRVVTPHLSIVLALDWTPSKVPFFSFTGSSSGSSDVALQSI